MKRVLSFLLLALTVGSFTAASSCLSTTETDGTDASGQPTLSDGDFPDALPCSSRDILPNDAQFVDTIVEADEIIHVHTEYTDDEALPAVCGLGDFDNALEAVEEPWDPATGTDVGICYTVEENISSHFVSGSGEPDGTNNPGMCRSTFGFSTDNDGDGFPRAGTYRVDACVAGETTSYQFRTRIIVLGEDVNKTLEQIGLDEVSSLEIWDADGAEVTTTQRAKEIFAENPYNFTFTVRSAEGVTTHLNVTVQVICVQQVSSCPLVTQGC